jgi:hypothetical protein
MVVDGQDLCEWSDEDGIPNRDTALSTNYDGFPDKSIFTHFDEGVL